MAQFARRKYVWVGIAVLAALVMLLSITTTARGDVVPWLQGLGLVMLSVFLLASARLCRCPRCDTFLFDRSKNVPELGWTMRQCPHCDAPLWRPGYREGGE